MAQKTSPKAKKGIKKGFFEVSAPITATQIQLYSTSSEELNGKTIKLDLTKNLRGKSLELKLRIKQEGEKLYAEPESIELLGSYIRRIMRNGVDYCEDSFETSSRDFLVVVKPFLITRKKVSRAVLKALRENAKKFLESYIRMRTAKEIISEIMTNKIQKQLALKLKKIYPLALCEIRVFKIVGALKESQQKVKEGQEQTISK